MILDCKDAKPVADCAYLQSLKRGPGRSATTADAAPRPIDSTASGSLGSVNWPVATTTPFSTSSYEHATGPDSTDRAYRRMFRSRVARERLRPRCRIDDCDQLVEAEGLPDHRRP